jgi:hypothetical protein
MGTQLVDIQSDNEVGLVQQLIMNPKVQRFAMKYAVKGLLSAAGIGFLHYVIVPAIFDEHDNQETGNVSFDDDDSWFNE